MSILMSTKKRQWTVAKAVACLRHQQQSGAIRIVVPFPVPWLDQSRIGRILTGGEGEGLFAATYRAEGPLDDPKVSVNPLAALAPGFLRGLFGIFEGGGSANGEADFTPLPPREAK